MRAEITAAMKQAMKDKDTLRLSTLRLILATIKDRDIAERATQGECSKGLDDAAITELMAKMIKQRQDSATQYEDAGRLELAENERVEIEVIREFLPPQLDEEETKGAVAQAVAATEAHGLKDIGRVMAHLKSAYAGRMDFAKASKQVKAALSS